MRSVSIILFFFLVWPVLTGLAAPEKLEWTNDQAMLIFFEAVTRIKRHALDSPDPGTIAVGAIKAYMKRHDPYGDYLTREEYQQWVQTRKYSYHGVGMEIIERDGHFYCLPRTAGPAQAVGIKQGDELVEVEGIPVSGRSIYWIGSRIRGEKNSEVKLKIVRSNDFYTFFIKRSPLNDTSVWLSRENGLDIIRISHFSAQSFEEIKAVLEKRNQHIPLVLDLRNNPGGDLFAAVDIAGLFLPQGSRILSIHTNKDTMDYTAKGRLWTGDRLAIWQNGFTASASEVLISSLTAHKVAVSFGSVSYGKAMTQTVMELSDGSALIISRGRLAGPDGNTWQNKGLAPVIPIHDSVRSWAQITRNNL